VLCRKAFTNQKGVMMMSVQATTGEKQIVRAQELASKAVSVFANTISDLQKANTMLSETITSETEAVNQHQLNITTANNAMAENNAILQKLTDIVPVGVAQ
jgi:hypothetical protein